MTEPLTILGIESSCDDTGVAVLTVSTEKQALIKANVVFGQEDLHSEFGGVVPEIAARAHVERLEGCLAQALQTARIALDDVDLIAATSGPGLIGGVLSGLMFAKGLATARKCPLVSVNHLAGHALTPRLTDSVDFPYLMLLVSGGHCQFLIVQGPDEYRRLGGTIDDAPGEAFDKSARVLGLPQPGGPSIEKAARDGDPTAFALPRPLIREPNCDMSFSGLKTAVKRAVDAEVTAKQGLTKAFQQNMSASFQAAVCDVLAKKSDVALQEYLALGPKEPVFAVAGGVSANQAIGTKLRAICEKNGVQFLAPPLDLCTDNAAMIAWAGYELYSRGHSHDMNVSARPRWPLDQSASAMLGSGKKGAKA